MDVYSSFIEGIKAELGVLYTLLNNIPFPQISTPLKMRLSFILLSVFSIFFATAATVAACGDQYFAPTTSARKILSEVIY